ncbi:hypothetical protein MHB84_05475 [Paenibacillus sp. FSL F4-0087]|uniref:hypothetical protein n=1 Tax=Paenibacillus sp. FSL F4-0087 TaxID=2921368 RepID=UPI00096D4A4E|nr:hypothetical protein BK122_27395 [Paenibacillus pabuli]
MDNIQNIIFKNKDFIDEFISDIFSQYVVQNNLIQEYFDDPLKIWGKYRTSLKDFDWHEDVYVDNNDIYQEVDRLKTMIIRISNEELKQFSDMYLFKAVSIYERMINSFYQSILGIKFGFDWNKCNQIIQKLKTIDKVGWFSEIIIGKSYLQEPGWGKVKPYIDARNFFIHYKPEKVRKYDKFENLLNKDRILEFLDEVLVCNDFLQSEDNYFQNHNKQLIEVKEHFSRTFAMKSPDNI